VKKEEDDELEDEYQELKKESEISDQEPLKLPAVT